MLPSASPSHLLVHVSWLALDIPTWWHTNFLSPRGSLNPRGGRGSSGSAALVWHSVARQGLLGWLGLAWLGQAWLGFAQFGLAWLNGLYWLDWLWPGYIASSAWLVPQSW